MIGRLSGPGRRFEVPCTVEIERSADSLHAYAIPEGVELRPGDRVLVHGAPGHVGFGESARFETRATVLRAGPLERAWTRFAAILELAELYHVGFEAEEAA
ncbi:hypothetical protein [Roseicella sp. DB1501]|jgi:hypothetical protein|uniref:hypothetical protein n=1 Tax=Roseicella sp. DB1501 TaxID=2730925 RepID=UPI0014925FDB|nr:hypothetical protein [Roseicella sp. DB1501]NOG71940.1 hypothetical protein [Roseicella sp. DB1501]